MESPSRAAVVPALWRRLRMSGGDDSFIVLKHVYIARHPGDSFDSGVYRNLRRECGDLVRAHFPHEMSVRMLLKPLGLGPRTQRAAMITGLVDRMEQEADQRDAKAKQLFQHFCAREGLPTDKPAPGQPGPSAQWVRQIGDEPYWVAEYGRAGDLLVIGRPAGGDGV